MMRKIFFFFFKNTFFFLIGIHCVKIGLDFLTYPKKCFVFVLCQEINLCKEYRKDTNHQFGFTSFYVVI